MTSKYYVTQNNNGKTIIYGNYNTDTPKEAIYSACGIAKKIIYLIIIKCHLK